VRVVILASAAVLSFFAARWNFLFTESMPPMRPLPYIGALSDAIIESVKHDVPVIALRDETWIWAGGLLNELDRRGLAFRVPPQWTFMFGKSRSRRGDERIHLLLADAHTHAELLGRPDLSLIASSDEKLVFRQLAAPRERRPLRPRRCDGRQRTSRLAGVTGSSARASRKIACRRALLYTRGGHDGIVRDEQPST
jgi:hypothetical protein